VHVVVVGAGAIGTYLACRLLQAGQVVTVVARASRVAELQRQGLRVRAGQRAWCDQPPIVERLEERPDLVLLATKTQDLAEACQTVLPAAEGVTAVALQNGVRGDAIAASILGPQVVVGGIAMCAATCLEPGQVTVDVPGWFILGGGTPSHLRLASQTLGQAVPTFTTANLPGARWSKLISNLNNGLAAASGLSLAELVRSPAGRTLSIRLMREGATVARAAGIHLDTHLYGLGLPGRGFTAVALAQGLASNLLPRLPEPVATRLMALAGKTSVGRLQIRGSTWQSLARGRPTEVDYLNGEIVRTGQAVGVAAPYNARIVEAVHAAERSQHAWRLQELWPSAA